VAAPATTARVSEESERPGPADNSAPHSRSMQPYWTNLLWTRVGARVATIDLCTTAPLPDNNQLRPRSANPDSGGPRSRGPQTQIRDPRVPGAIHHADQAVNRDTVERRMPPVPAGWKLTQDDTEVVRAQPQEKLAHR
jgi:hypothetical protein